MDQESAATDPQPGVEASSTQPQAPCAIGVAYWMNRNRVQWRL